MTVLLEDTRWWFVVLSGALGVFAVFAVVLAAVGIYAVTACSVAQRTREIGIRIALGALPHQIAWSAVGRVLAHVGAGLILGVAGALAVGRVIEGLLFHVSPVDPFDPGGRATDLRGAGGRGVRGTRPTRALARSVGRAASRVAGCRSDLRCDARQFGPPGAGEGVPECASDLAVAAPSMQ